MKLLVDARSGLRHAHPRRDGALLAVGSWTQAMRTWAREPTLGEARLLRLEAEGRNELLRVCVAHEPVVPGHDGVPIAVSLVMRPERMPGGNVSESGTVTRQEDIAALLEMSSHPLRERLRRPAVMLEHGVSEGPVEVWQSAEFVSRLAALESTDRPVVLNLALEADDGQGSTREQGRRQLAGIWASMRWQFGAPGFQPPGSPWMRTVPAVTCTASSSMPRWRRAFATPPWRPAIRPRSPSTPVRVAVRESDRSRFALRGDAPCGASTRSCRTPAARSCS